MTETIKIETDLFPVLAYNKAGNGSAIVLLHGFPESRKLWDKVVPFLAAYYKVIVPDMPGSGDSTFNGDEVSMEQLADSVALILEHEHIKEVVIAGHSMGGYAALAFAERYKPKVKGLSLVHSNASADDEPKKELRRKSIELIRKGGREAFIRQMIPNLFSGTFKTNHPKALEANINEGLKLEGRSLIAFYNAMINRPDRISILQNAIFPVQWLAGKEDTIAAPAKMLQQSMLANVNFVSVYPGVAHMSMIEDPERISRDILEFAAYCFSNKPKHVDAK